MAGHPYCIETQEQANAAFKSFCEHISQGYPQWSWYIKTDLVTCTCETLIKTIKEKPQLFDTILKQMAHSEAYKIWFNKGQKMVDGEIKGSYSPQVWQCIMRNMFGKMGWWESENQKEQSQNEEAYNIVKTLAAAMTSQAPQGISQSNKCDAQATTSEIEGK